MPRPFRPCEIRIGRPIERRAATRDRADDRLVLRQIIDEVMYEIRELSRQEYVDEYATSKHDAMPTQPTAIVLGPDGNVVATRSAAVAAGARRRPAARDRPLRRRRRRSATGSGAAGARRYPRRPWPSIAITLPDGSTRTVPPGTTAGDLAAAHRPPPGQGRGDRRGQRRASATSATALADGDAVAIVTADTDRGLFTIRHSTAHVLAQAVLDLFPGATFGIGPPVEDGFYYDFELPGGGTFTPDDLDRIDARMREIIAEHQPFVRDEIPADEAREIFADHPLQARDHRERLDRPDVGHRAPGSSAPTRTRRRKPKDHPPFHGRPGFIDLCRGPHVARHRAHLGHFKLMRVAGAYWRGDEQQPAAPAHLRHGVGQPSKALDDHLHQLEEAGQARPPQARRRARPVPLPDPSSAAACRCTTRRAASSAS